ncbi:hypothetical protein FisN_9Lh148 [Fistulifera solaris]|uniref:S-adenosylmethionine-dependent methyltransferase domain-containing protein n=1 Tax=Fistulifera solaris TaxID=1519565 RepID=A0A1Z5KKM4_FISSO|nr:hypothetical protein FisN_9Lh148 [Fistulifera solaris]|eukprot:GAX26863.1 hypothetical protein FisN_9Lh148 [Fistulifera solaris]
MAWKHTYLMSVIAQLIFLPPTASFTTAPSVSVKTPTWALPSSPIDNNSRKKKTKSITIKELSQKIKNNPTVETTKKAKYRRSRKRVENPKQTYLYKSQRERLERTGELPEELKESSLPDVLAQAKEFGMVPSAQHCDPDGTEPQIVGRIKVSDEENSGSYAYLIEKPAGWAILGGGGGSSSKKVEIHRKKDTKSQKHRVIIQEKDGTKDVLEYDESDILAWMTPEEIEEYNASQEAEEETKQTSITIVDQDDDSVDTVLDDDSDVVEVMVDDRDEEEDFVEIFESGPSSFETDGAPDLNEEDIDPKTLENLRRITARRQMQSRTASFAPYSRPSVVSWLKDIKAKEGMPVRGGNFWTALAGAADVDDSGLVLLCPKANAANVFVELTEYVAVLGTGGYVAPKSKLKASKGLEESIVIEELSRMRKGRLEDTVHIVKVTIPDHGSTCGHIIDTLQSKYKDGIRGDPSANPLDRRAQRRLVHCGAMTVSSLICDETITYTVPAFPDDIAILVERSTDLFKAGRFRGRSGLMDNPLTTCYREVNGIADGIPGWTVDRYDKWLFVQHDPQHQRGPLPSIHDGKTAGVYYLEARQDRSVMGSQEGIKPRLLEGQPLKGNLTVLENGIKYVVSLDKDFSTGIFLDQRPQRAWLSQNCDENTHVLNCFAHTGAFSVAAASAGASTVSLDLSQKWLGRLPEHFKANNIPFDERHDCIYGDCFDWLERLAKRGEKYDIVILDPPSSSVGGRKKKRWSIKSDLDELVSLAAKLVKDGGLLWTTTNSATLTSVKMAKMCLKGLEEAGIESARLERIQPMPYDFPSTGSQPVKNLIWRIR